MMNTKVNQIMPVKNGDMTIKEFKGFSRSLKSGGIPKSFPSLEDSDKLFSEKLKEMVLDDRAISGNIGKKLREPDAGLNPVVPKYEKQGGVKNSPVSDSSEGITDSSRQQVETVNSEAAFDTTVVNNGLSVRENQQTPANPDNGQSDSELLNAFGYDVNIITDEGEKNLSDTNNQSLLLQLQGVFAPVVNHNREQTDLGSGLNEDENGEAFAISGIDTENRTNSDLTAENPNSFVVNPDLTAVNPNSFVVNPDLTAVNLKPSAANSNALSEKPDTEKTEDGNLPLQNGSKNSEIAENGKISNSRPTQSAYTGKLYKGTLADLIKQGELIFGNVFSLTVTDKGIFIGGEGDSKENEANLVGGDFLQKLYEILGERLENPDQLTARDQLRQMLISAIQKAVSAMHDPVKKEEEYQQKLLEFLMKFVDAINGKDDEDKRVALEKDEKDNGGLLLQLIENLIEASKKNSEDDEYTAAIYVSTFEIGLLTSDQSFEENAETDADTSAAAVEQISDSDVKTNSQRSGYRNTEVQIPAENKIPVVHKAVENASDVTELNNDKTAFYVHHSEVIEGPRTIPTYGYSEKESVSPIFEDINANLFENVSSRYAEENSDLLNDASNQSIAVDAVRTEKAADNANSGVNAQKNETAALENAPKNENAVPEKVQATNLNGIYKAVQQSGDSSQNNSDGEKRSIIPPALQFKHKVKGASDEIDELKRLFGVKNRDEEKMKEKNELIEETEETDENRTDENRRTDQRTAFTKDSQTVQRAIGKDGSKEDFQKSIIEAVTLETVKTDIAPVARGYAAEENGAKQIIGQIFSEMLNSLSSSSNSGRTVTTLTMTLTPESLGKITMKISEEAGKISLLVTAHNKETAEILSQRMDAMQQAAKDSGTQLEKYQVVYGPEQDGKAGQQNYDGSSKNPYVRQDAEEAHKEVDGQFAEFLKQAV